MKWELRSKIQHCARPSRKTCSLLATVNNPAGYLALVLHAHLPFVRHPENERHLEEAWLFEAVAETYLPLVRMLRGLQEQKIPVRLAISISSTLGSMLLDPLLQDRCARHLDSLVDLAEKEVHRTLFLGELRPVAEFYLEHFRELRGLYADLDRDIPAAFGEFHRAGMLELFTTTATHAVLPLLRDYPACLRAQVLAGRASHEECFGESPRGIWLPECAFFPGLDEHLAEAGYRWFILDSHGVLHATPRPRFATFAPLITPGGLAAFGRDHASARQVWSRHHGYPGDPNYRDFFRDAGFDLEFDHIRPHLSSPDLRGFTGIKYYRITGAGREKEPYDRPAALERVRCHAQHFLQTRQTDLSTASTHMDRPALAVAPYDAELFGHWWFEGPEFLETLFRAAVDPAGCPGINFVTPSDYLASHPVNQLATPSASTWGEGGHLAMWLNEKTAELYPPLRSAQRRMEILAGRARESRPAKWQRTLAQAGRELLLAQSSDWPFIISSGTSAQYARARFKTHIDRFNALAEMLERNQIDFHELTQIEQADNLFPKLDASGWC